MTLKSPVEAEESQAKLSLGGFLSLTTDNCQRLSKTWQTVVMLTGVIVAGLISIFGAHFLSEEFRFDAETIAKVGHTPVDQRVGDEGSFAVIADFYKSVGLIDHPLAAGLLGVLVGSMAIFLGVRKAGGIRKNLFSVGLVAVGFILSGVFLGQYTKEIFISLAMIVVLGVPRTWWGELLGLLAMAGVAVWFRPYWGLLIAVYVVARFVPPAGIAVKGQRISYKNPICFVVLMALASIAFSVVIGAYTGDGGDHFRSSVNQWRANDGSTTTLIPAYVHTSPLIGGILNNLITTVFLVVPLPLLGLMKPYYIASALLFMFLWSGLFIGYYKLRESHHVWAMRAFAIMTGFLVVQGVFEPDYGSALRHLVPLVPLLILLRDFDLNSNGVPSYEPISEHDPSEA